MSEAIKREIEAAQKACGEDAPQAQLVGYLAAEVVHLRRLMRRAIPTIDSRETDYADEFKTACR